MRGGASQPGGSGARSGLAGIGIAAFAVACCAVLPLLAGALGGLAAGAWLGIGAGAAVLVCVVLGVAVIHRRNDAGGEQRQ